MDFDPRITSDGYGGEHGWSCNFHFGHGRDVIQEEVENEKSCVQALKLMITQADDKIHDLEDELAILQCQLKWNESDKQKDLYEVCCATFKQKIDSLTSSIQRLKDENVTRKHVMDEAIEIQEPAERICDIISTLIRSDSPDPLEQDKQSGFTISEESSSDAAICTAKDTKDQRCMSKSDEDVPRNARIDASRTLSEEKNVALPLNPVVAQTPLPDSSAESNSKLDTLPPEQGEKCGTESATGESGSSASSAPAVMRAEKDNYITIASDSSSELQDHGRDIPVGDHLKRKLHSDLDPVQQSIPTLMLKPGQVLENMESTSNTEHSVQPYSFFKKERGSPLFRKSNKQNKVGDSGIKKQQILRVKKEKGIVVSPVSDLDDLKQKISENPDFLQNLRVFELKAIAKQNKWTGLTKLKKEKMIEEMIKHLGP